ncbi:MAG: BREX-2 system phosphatase PglZ [Gemmataceae bacterium]
MTVGKLSAQQIRSLVEDKWQRDEDASAVGLHVTASWTAPSEVEFDFGKARVVRADTVFQVRQELATAEQGKVRIILLTRLQQGDLGNDVVARLARSRLFPVDHWASLCALFKAKELDRSVCDPALAQALMEYAPADGYPPVSAGVLDAGTVWRAVSRHVFDMGESDPDLASLLLWASGRSGSSRYLGVAEELRDSLRRRLTSALGDAADSILGFVDSSAGADALALAIACQVVFGSGDEKALDAAAARMEQFHRNRPIPQGVGRTLGRVAAEAVADLDRKDDPRIAGKHLDRADALLRQLRSDDHAYRNGLTLLGYEQRLARFGTQIEAVLDAPGGAAIAACERLQSEVASHRIARLGRRAEQVSRSEMALRLVRWLAQPAPPATSFAEMADVYRKELAFVDWARESVCRGEEVAGLSKAYRRLDQAVLIRRQEFNRAFAQALADWTSSGSTSGEVHGVEDVLSRVVARVAGADNRVLLVVLDGMSWAVCHELLEDVRRDHWFEATLDESSSPPAAVIAAVPSVTNLSRMSLLSGRLEWGDASAEKRNFEAHPVLRGCCDRRHPPILFHKREVSEGGRGAVGDDLGRAILSTNHRVVGVVVNAIDDFLSKGDQMPMVWAISRISPLGSLLKLARDSGRVVILASDHGHVWHRPDATVFDSDKGGRWRVQGSEMREGEMLLTGGRVLDHADGHAVVVPWSESLYYGRQQNGYHGGVTPQEMICPLVLLTDRSSAYSGLHPCEYPRPEWWSSAPTATALAEEPPVILAPRTGQRNLFEGLDERPRRPAPTEPQPSRAETAQPAAPTSWVRRLLASEAYKAQKELIRRHAPEDDVVRRCLETLDAHGGIMTPTAFAKVAEVPAARLDGLIARVQRLLNVDGYEILTLSRTENRIELNAGKLKRQFDME